jgi:hypothetical protein
VGGCQRQRAKEQHFEQINPFFRQLFGENILEIIT